LYDYARNNITLPEPIKARSVYIEELQVINYNKNVLEMRVVCGGGTYMRSLVHDLAVSMGTCGHMTVLKRTRQGIFNVKGSLDLDQSTFSVQTVLKQIVAQRKY
jgi:tRNA pseudouridine55 synthase